MLPLVEALVCKIVIDATNPVAKDWSPILIGEEDSGAEQVARMLPESLVVKAFNTIFADVLTPTRLDCDVRLSPPISLRHEAVAKTA
jgi:predicted dinucleotide-binding enzyme